MEHFLFLFILTGVMSGVFTVIAFIKKLQRRAYKKYWTIAKVCLLFSIFAFLIQMANILQILNRTISLVMEIYYICNHEDNVADSRQDRQGLGTAGPGCVYVKAEALYPFCDYGDSGIEERLCT